MTADYLQKQSRPGWPPLSDDLQEGLSMWCPLPDSNRHGRCRPRDFKSLVSTSFTKRAPLETRSSASAEPASPLPAGRAGRAPAEQRQVHLPQLIARDFLACLLRCRGLIEEEAVVDIP